MRTHRTSSRRRRRSRSGAGTRDHVRDDEPGEVPGGLREARSRRRPHAPARPGVPGAPGGPPRRRCEVRRGDRGPPSPRGVPDRRLRPLRGRARWVPGRVLVVCVPDDRAGRGPHPDAARSPPVREVRDGLPPRESGTPSPDLPGRVRGLDRPRAQGPRGLRLRPDLRAPRLPPHLRGDEPRGEERGLPPGPGRGGPRPLPPEAGMMGVATFERLAPPQKGAVRGLLFAVPLLLPLGYILALEALLPPVFFSIAFVAMVGYLVTPLGAEFWVPSSVLAVQASGGGVAEAAIAVASVVLVDWFTALFLLWNFDLAERAPFLGRFIDKTEERCRGFLDEKPWRRRLAVVALAVYVALPVQM